MKCLVFQALLSSSLLVGILADGPGYSEPGMCRPCKKVEGDGPDAGSYYLWKEGNARCTDGCIYSRGNDLYCFEKGIYIIADCGDDMGPTIGEEYPPTPGEEPGPTSGEENSPTPGEETGPTTTEEMRTVTFQPPGTGSPATEGVTCGMRRGGGECIQDQDGRIVNGQEAGCNEWPWQVGIVSRQGDQVSADPFCGGTLVNENHVITAAHCMPGQTTSNTAVVLGDHDLNMQEPAQGAYGVSAIYNHPAYDSSTNANDITILRLSVPVNTTMFTPACFPTFSTGQSLNGRNGTISGWGALEYGTGDYPSTLQEVQDLIPIVNREICVTDTEPWIYEPDILPGMLCAGGPGLGMDTCQGDSGGPLTNQFSPNRYQLVGVVSWGRNCAKSYGVYADVAYYTSWIEPITGPLYRTPE